MAHDHTNQTAAHRFATHGICLFGWAYLLIVFGAILLDLPIRYAREKKRRLALAAALTLAAGAIFHGFVGYRDATEATDWLPAQFDYIWCGCSWYLIMGILMLPFRVHRVIAAKHTRPR